MESGKSISIENATKLTQMCFDFYDKTISKNGKPNSHEWTTIAAIILDQTNVHGFQKKYKILSFSSGTKCLPVGDLPKDGSLVHDSHAEVLARRGLLRYLYSEMQKIAKNKSYKSDVVEHSLESSTQVTDKFDINKFAKFYMFCSHVPCGDASIIPKTDDNLNDDEDCPPVKKSKQDSDIHRTGARCVPNSELQDSKENGLNYHALSVLRTKPGRGEPTISMSCSDKLAKWLVVGLQGALLSNLLCKPIYLDGLIVSKCQFNEESIMRALVERSKSIDGLPEHYKCHAPFVISTNLKFKDSKSEKLKSLGEANAEKLNACPTSICWSKVDAKQQIVLVKGNLLGLTQKTQHTAKSRLLISKYSFMQTFMGFLKKENDQEQLNNKTYYDLKQLDGGYNLALARFYEVYKGWIRNEAEKYYLFKTDKK